MATITRVFEFDSAHRIMNEKVKCFNLHGHRFKAEATFEYYEKGALGYAIDFKEIKRIVGDWIEEYLDHACLLNPQDAELIAFCRERSWKLYVMGMGCYGDINPSAENIASELFHVIRTLFIEDTCASITRLRLYETPNCWVEVEMDKSDYKASEKFASEITEWRKRKGNFNYDSRIKE